MKVVFPRGDNDQLYHAVANKRAVDEDGKPVCKTTNDPITNYRYYKVEFLDGTTEVLTSNMID